MAAYLLNVTCVAVVGYLRIMSRIVVEHCHAKLMQRIIAAPSLPPHNSLEIRLLSDSID
jgi:hypothetical protein